MRTFFVPIDTVLEQAVVSGLATMTVDVDAFTTFLSFTLPVFTTFLTFTLQPVRCHVAVLTTFTTFLTFTLPGKPGDFQ
jgi:hypothetical protein